MGLSSLRRWRNLVGRNTPVALEIRAVLAKHKVWSCRGKSIRLYGEGNLYTAHVRAGDATPELAPVEPSSSWTRMEVDDGQRDEQDESVGQPEELRRVLAAGQPTELERQKHSQTNHAVFAPWCEEYVKAKGTGAQHRRQDFFNMSEGGVSTPMLALKFSRSGRMAATALEQKGLTQHGVKFFAGFIQQTGVRMFVNKSDGEPAMKALKDAAAKAPEGVESISHRIASGRPPSKR